jgi:hypothetical protein
MDRRDGLWLVTGKLSRHGQRRNDDRERPGHPVGEQQRQLAWTSSYCVDHVRCMTCDLSTLLTQSIEPDLKSAGVKNTPVLQEGFQPVARHASFPPRPEVDGRSIASQPAAELAHASVANQEGSSTTRRPRWSSTRPS